MLDAKGEPRMYIAVDTAVTTPDQSQDAKKKDNVFAHWKVELVQSVCQSLERAISLSNGLGYDHQAIPGPSMFAREIVQIMGGVCIGGTAETGGFPASLQQFPHLIELASLRKTVFGEVFEDPPRKRYLVEKDEVAAPMIADLLEVLAALHEEIFNKTHNRNAVRYHRLSTRPQVEMLKIWRVVFVILSMHDKDHSDVMDQRPLTAWNAIKDLLAEDRPAKERLATCTKRYDPVDGLEMLKDADPRYRLAQGLLRNVKGPSLQKEGATAMLIFEWCVVAISIRTMKKESLERSHKKKRNVARDGTLVPEISPSE